MMKKPNQYQQICIWLPSPLGDAVLATPALNAIRKKFANAQITFIATPTVKEFLTPTNFCDDWIVFGNEGLLKTAKKIKESNAQAIILLKNSFSSALAAVIASVPERIGYARDFRTALLTRKVRPARDKKGKFIPRSMVDYYLELARKLGCDVSNRKMRLQIDKEALHNVAGKIPAAFSPEFPLVIFVPGGAYGPSKLWPTERFALLADQIIEKYRATIVVSVAPDINEQKIAQQIASQAKNKIYTTAETPLTPAELKALINEAQLVITNDTGPRHIAIALDKKLITLFGPNNPQWTNTGYEYEVQIIGQADCAPCDKPTCSAEEHYCMQSITTDIVFENAVEILNSEI